MVFRFVSGKHSSWGQEQGVAGGCGKRKVKTLYEHSELLDPGRHSLTHLGSMHMLPSLYTHTNLHIHTNLYLPRVSIVDDIH